jgi:CubicO group peptidase (beta-lactamase class C family)
MNQTSTNMKRKALLVALMCTVFSVHAQSVADKIESQFAPWNEPHRAGGVVLVSQNNQVVFSKAYGLASITYNIPNTTNTVFNIGSVSKQFTAMGILLLQQEGKISLDDDIRKYLTDINNFGKPITIRHLLHHTSGLRSAPEFLGLAGWRDGDAISNEDFYRYVCKQKTLNMETGSAYMYTNSGYILLAKIIETVTQQSFKTWMQDKVFKPLAMDATFIEEDASNILPNVASSYTEVGPSQFKSIENYDQTYGASNVYSTSTDLLKWTQHFIQPKPAWKSAFEALQTLDLLSNGAKNNYAFGLFIDAFYGNKRIQHTGAIAGFRSVVYCYPDDQLIIIVLTNFSSPNQPNYGDPLSQLFLQDKSEKPKAQQPYKALALAEETLKKYEGSYWSNDNNFVRKIVLENNTLWYVRNPKKKSALIPIQENLFKMDGVQDDVRLQFDLKTNQFNFITNEKVTDVFEKYDDEPITAATLEAYVGTYYSDELETSYTITLTNSALIGYHSRFGTFEIQLLKKDVLDFSGMAIAKCGRNAKRAVTGFGVSINRVKNVWFERK